MSELEARFDGMFLAIAQQHTEGISSLLDSFFSFLLRKTDFYTGQSDPKMGEEMVMKSFKKYQSMANEKVQEEQRMHKEKDEERRRRIVDTKKKEEEEFRRHQEDLARRPKIEEVTDEPSSVDKQDKEVERSSEKGDKDEEDDMPPPVGNGGQTDKYIWTQTLNTAEMHVSVPPGTRAKFCVVDIKTNHIKVGIKGQPLIIDGDFPSPVKVEECLWTLVDNKTIQITVEKIEKMNWWSSMIKGDPTINTKKIVPENSKLSDLDGETRATVEKMMFDQNRKNQGLPTSDQMKQHELLEKFKKAHPEMDFSQAKVNYGGGGNFNM